MLPILVHGSNYTDDRNDFQVSKPLYNIILSFLKILKNLVKFWKDVLTHLITTWSRLEVKIAEYSISCHWPLSIHHENIRKKEVFSDIFRGYRKRPVARNGLSCSVLCCIYFKLKVKTPNKNSHTRCSVKKDVLKNFVKFTGKHLCQSLFLIKLQATLITLTSFYRTPLDDYFWPKWLQLFSNSEHVFTCSEVHQMLPEGTIN